MKSCLIKTFKNVYFLSKIMILQQHACKVARVQLWSISTDANFVVEFACPSITSSTTSCYLRPQSYCTFFGLPQGSRLQQVNQFKRGLLPHSPNSPTPLNVYYICYMTPIICTHIKRCGLYILFYF